MSVSPFSSPHEVLSYCRTLFVGLCLLLLATSDAAKRFLVGFLNDLEETVEAWYGFRRRCAELKTRFKAGEKDLDIRLIFAYPSEMARREITPAQAFGTIAGRIEKRIEVLRNTGLEGYNMTIPELDLIARQLRKAQDYFVQTYSETTVRPRNRT